MMFFLIPYIVKNFFQHRFTRAAIDLVLFVHCQYYRCPRRTAALFIATAAMMLLDTIITAIA